MVENSIVRTYAYGRSGTCYHM